ncbi:MAG: site-2 protease family protein [Cereibacter changlensis]
MDLPRPALVKQIELHLSVEGRGFSYLLCDRVSGQILRLSRQAALAYRGFAGAALGDAAARDRLSQEDAKRGFTALAWLRQMRDGARFTKKRFNPLQMQIPLLDAGRLQPPLEGLARRCFGWPGAVALVLLALVVLVLGIRNDWAIMVEFRDVFSVEALLTFGLVSPFLKLIHETGHLLAATRCGVRLRKAGLNLIGLYPIPYVDCSEADLVATRGQRILISAAGILTDIAVGLTLFICWHLTDGAELRQVLGRAFVFSVFSSIVFNANPLMRMDGYFILADVLGHRNLGTDATASLRRLWRSGLGLTTQPPRFRLRTEIVLALYGLASMIYRWFILATLVWNLLPRYLGVGLIVGAWGGWLMFVGPLLQKVRAVPPPGPEAAPVEGKPRRRAFAALAGLALVGLAFVPLSPVTVIDMAPDTLATYSVTIDRPGAVLRAAAPDARVEAGQPLLALENADIASRLALAELRRAEADLARRIDTAVGAAGAQRGAEQVATAEAQLALARADAAALQIKAPAAGRFTLTRVLHPGEYLAAGTVIGQFLPEAEETVLVGAFPESRVQHFDRGLSDITLRVGGRYLPVATDRARLAEEVRTDAEAATAQRSFTLRLAFDASPAGFGPGGAQARIAFAPIPVWRHAAGWVAAKIAQFRDAEIAERQQRLENT